MARAPARPGPGLTSGGSGVRGSGRIAYFKGVWDELRKVIWPTRAELWRMTGVVIITVILFSLLIGGADFGLGYVIKPLYGSSATSSSGSNGAPTVPSAIPSSGASPSATGSPAATPSSSASLSASPSATPTG